jgi:hypothetical protein
MSRSQAVRTGFTEILKQPAVLAAELAWRWAFAVTGWMLATYALLIFLKSLPVSDAQLLGLSGIIPGTVGYALASIFAGSGPKMVKVIVVLAMGMAVLWWFAASVGRTVTLRALMPGRDARFADMFRLHAVRVVMALVVALAYVGSIMLASSYAAANARFRMVFWPLVILIVIAWSSLSWYLTLAPVVATRNTGGTLRAIFDAAIFSRERGSQFAWVSFFFGLVRFSMFIAGLFVFLFVLSIALQLPAAAAIVLLALYAGVYSAVATFLHLARLAAYVRIVEWQP